MQAEGQSYEDYQEVMRNIREPRRKSGDKKDSSSEEDKEESPDKED